MRTFPIVRQLLLILLLMIGLGCKRADKARTDARKGPQPDAEAKDLPRDAFHGFAPGKDSPRDPDFHKGSFLDEKVGLKKGNIKDIKKIKTPDDMIAAFSGILINKPEDVPAWIMVGVGHSLKGEYREAIKKFKKSLGIKKTADAFSNMAFAYYDLGNLDEALKNHKEAISLNPNMANSFYGLALIYEDRKDYPNALSNWEKFVTIEGKKDNKDVKKIDKVQKRVDLLKRALAMR